MFERRPEEDFEVGQLVSWVDTEGNAYPARITGFQGPFVRSKSDGADGSTRTFSWHGEGWVCGCMTLVYGQVVTPEQVAPKRKITQREVDQALLEHGTWLIDSPNGRRVEWSGLDLSNIDLSLMTLACARLVGTDLRGSNLSQTDLTDADLTGADLRGANLTSCALKRTVLAGADLRGVLGLTPGQLAEALVDSRTRSDFAAPGSAGPTPVQARPTLEQWGLELARVVATRSPCVRRQVGAVLIKDARIVGHGYNGPPRGLPHRCSEPGLNQCVRIGQAPGSAGAACCVHAEANALMFSDRGDARGATLYCTHSPCLACAQMAINAGVVRVVSAEQYPDEAGRAELLKAGVSFLNRGAEKK